MLRRRDLILAAADPTPPTPRFVGITVMPEYIQSEGPEAVLDNLIRRSRVTAVATSPYVMEPAPDGQGSREPPIDAGAGAVRLLDRPLWGKRELTVRTEPSFAPDPLLYRGLPYQPSTPGALTRREGPVIQRFLRAARDRGLETYLQVQAAIPPGYRVQFGGPLPVDRPVLPDGRERTRRVDNNGSLASPAIRRYTEALLLDMHRHYPEVTGYRIDWPEYPPYLLDDLFLDFSAPAEAAARKLGFNFRRMRADSSRLYKLLHGGLTEKHLADWRARGESLFTGFAEFPGFTELRRFRARLSAGLLAGYRRALTAVAGPKKELVPNAFPPPLSAASGMDFAAVASSSNAISVKLYTMHWPMMLRFYGDALAKANPALPEAALVATLAHWFDISDGPGRPKLADYVYPEPDAPHNVGAHAQARKIQAAQAAAGKTPVIALAHGYGPPGDFEARLQVAYRAAHHRVWINRYGYLSDRKLDIIGQVTMGEVSRPA